MVGNAVPVNLAYEIAKSIRVALTNSSIIEATNYYTCEERKISQIKVV